MLLLGLALTGCMSPVVLLNPQTGQITQCLATGAFPLINQHQCVASYENLGWVQTTAAEAQQAQRDRVARRDDEVKAAAEECRNSRLRGDLKSYVASVQCSNPRIREANATAGYPFMDLLDVELATRLSNAEKIDRGQMTEVEASLSSAELHSRMVAEGRRRLLEAQAAENQSTMAQAAQTQAQGALLSGLGNYNASTQPRGITCTSYGPTTRCY
jgi:hypothetical protein